MTKIYSLLVDDFIIYDSRVGAALGLLVVRYCQAQNLSTIPPLLRFPWAPANETNTVAPKNRNPSIGNLCIGQIRRAEEHVRWNLRASWLLRELVGKSQQFSEQGNSLRALEAALFMIGYDLGNSEERPPEKEEDAVYPLTTHGKGNSFRVDFNPQRHALIFSYPTKSNGKQRTPDEFALDQIQKICAYLERQFNGAEFPLANNVERLGKKTEKPGLGMAIRTIPESVTKAQASSYLGPYLEEVGVLNLVDPRPAKWILAVTPRDAVAAILDYNQQG
jgi:hypothetical protein